ncbi:hypothetical protein Thebr_1421 [Thermoanaerobacter brockii subsp. finnii Ako-1]|uniref:Uncharacterized protein n=2 Tax=Thermoanaerobacteraceae TaxID=186814 RepID=E8UU03_THEBF|nr:hypothetical protein Thebr_1421 [Thermoanaerobacter brockii subsp. finnii Ako-1]
MGMEAVLLIGCEIRTYMRIGLGYLGSWVGFLGFAVGYLPFTLFYEQHMNFLKATRITETFGSIINVGVGKKKSIKKRALILNACYNRSG